MEDNGEELNKPSRTAKGGPQPSGWGEVLTASRRNNLPCCKLFTETSGLV